MMTMKKMAIYLLMMLVFPMLLTGCMDNYDTVPEKTERILLTREHAFIARNEGGTISIEPLGAGKWNHSNGPTMAYDVNMSIQTTPITVEVKTADNINLTTRPICSWQAVEGRSLDLVLNFMFDDIPELSSNNSIQIFKVPIQAVFNQNVMRFFDQAARDVVDQYKSKDVNPDVLGQQIKRELDELLKGYQIPRTVLIDGKPVFDSEQKISIADVINIKGVTIQGYKNPPIVEASITKIESIKADVSKLQTELKAVKKRKLMKEQKARHAKKTAITMKLALKKNPHMKSLQKLEVLRSVLEDANEKDVPMTTTISLIPETMMDKVRFQMNIGNDGKPQITIKQ